MDSLSFLTDNAIANAVKDLYGSFAERRKALGLPNPGTVETIAREVQGDVLPSNFMFTGLRADMTKVTSMSPLFRTTHSFVIGSQGNLPPYALSSMFGTDKVFLQGNIGSDGGLATVGNFAWCPSLITKAKTQIMGGGGQGFLELTNDYTGPDCTASLKAANPSVFDGGLTGIFVGNYMQSITPRLALGLEATYQRPSIDSFPEAGISYFGRYKGDDWIASAGLLSAGALNTSYWRKLSDKVEAGVDMTLQATPTARGMTIALKKDGSAAVGAKYQFRTSTFRAQVDSAGKLGCLLERQVAMPISLTFAGEIDQAKQQAKIGLGVSLEMPSEELMDMQDSGQLPTPPSIPF